LADEIGMIVALDQHQYLAPFPAGYFRSRLASCILRWLA
jgi:hypothetical protein